MKYEITRNENFNSYEITFDGKPAENVRDLLKANGYRWHGRRGIWYGYKDIADELNSNGETMSTPATTKTADNDKEQQAALLARYLDEYNRIFGTNERMNNYLRGSIARLVELDGGELLEIEKPNIQTRFCFGHGFCGRSTDDDYLRAQNMAHHARTEESYFLKKNLSQLSDTVDKITAWQEQHRMDGRPAREPFLCDHFDNSDKIKKLTFMHPWDFDNLDEERKRHLRRPTVEELDSIKKAYETETAAFEKRLKTYLKRYGLTKLDVWTYLAD